MDRAELTVRNFLMVYQIRKEPTVPRHTLFGVDDTIIFPADTEFPRDLPQLDFFVRFLVGKPGIARLRIRVQWDDDRAPPADTVRFRFERSFATPGIYQDEAVRIPRIRFPGEGRYQVILSQKCLAAETWRGIVWKRLRTEYLFVMRRS